MNDREQLIAGLQRLLDGHYEREVVEDAIYALSQQQAEPVAWRYENLVTGSVSLLQEQSSAFTLGDRTYSVTPLYASPPADDEAVRLHEFAGFLSVELPELHKVEMPRIKAAIDAYLAKVKG